MMIMLSAVVAYFAEVIATMLFLFVATIAATFAIVFLRLFLFWPDIVGRMRKPHDPRAYHSTFVWEFAQGAWWAVLFVATVICLLARFG
jgi:hypothetical protein